MLLIAVDSGFTGVQECRSGIDNGKPIQFTHSSVNSEQFQGMLLHGDFGKLCQKHYLKL